MRDNEIWIVVPAYNEAAVITDTISNLRSLFRWVVVVDDCSTDDTGVRALNAGAVVCRHPVNLGQGASLQTGVDYALKRGADTVVTFDADGQHLSSDALKMVVELNSKGLDVVLASRFLGSTVGMSASRGLLLKLATFYTRFTTGLQLTDTHNGLRVMSRAAAEKIKLRQNRMAHASEILSQISAQRLQYCEFPATVIYTEHSKRKGQKMSGAFTILFDLLLGKLYR